MAKHMSKTLAGEIADRTLAVVNPQNRVMAMEAALKRHGFARQAVEPQLPPDRAGLIAWLLETYAAR